VEYLSVAFFQNPLGEPAKALQFGFFGNMGNWVFNGIKAIAMLWYARYGDCPSVVRWSGLETSPLKK
jgi:hypothetical protein